jgi:hypothetical protein
MTKGRDANIENTKRLMGALLRMPPKPHKKMRVGRKTKQQSDHQVKPTK